MDASNDVSPGIVLWLALLLFWIGGLIGWFTREFRASKRWKQRLEGNVLDGSIEYVLEDLKFSSNRNSTSAEEKLSLSASLFGFSMGVNRGVRESVRLSVDVPAETRMAEVLSDIERAGRLQFSIRPFAKGKEASADKLVASADDG